jgi:hypothetical protein
MKCQCGGLLKKIKTGMVCRRCMLFYPKLKVSEVFDDSKMLEKMFKDCGRPIEFLDCVATNQCKSTTPTIKLCHLP